MDILVMSDIECTIPSCEKTSTDSSCSCHFIDTMDDKHIKYMDKYSCSELFWGIGIENETYLMKQAKCGIKQFRNLKQKRERYSIDYYKSFAVDPLQHVLKKAAACETITYPIYVNSHTFQATDPKEEHRTIYDVHSTPNPAFTESIHNLLLRENDYYKKIYDTSLVFDGDSIEFITQDFYCSTVDTCVQELITLKHRFMEEVSPFFVKSGLGSISFPDHNYGMVSFLTTKNRNLSLCNNGTYHINITLPTLLDKGTIIDKPAFIANHLQVVPYFQIVEPLLTACYGTPDMFAILEPSLNYAMGSLRARLSRYISLQTFDADHPVNGKVLLIDTPTDPIFWQNQFEDSPYLPNPKTGCDINFNKFKNHGIELRFMDWFPEEYLADIVYFFLLLAQHSLTIGKLTWNKSGYNTIIKNCVSKGFFYVLSLEECNMILNDLHLPTVVEPMTAHRLLCVMCDTLHERYSQADLIQKMAPTRKKPQLVNYNRIAFDALYRDIYGKPEIIIRAETHPLEERVPLIPRDLDALRNSFTIFVETSPNRCYSDEEYRSCGATIVKKDHWLTRKDAIVLGIKGIQQKVIAGQTHLHFAHCFKHQEGWMDRLNIVRDSTFIDYEYMVDSAGKRVISFCGQSGKIGCYLALMTYYRRQMKYTDKLPLFNEETYRMVLKNLKAYFNPMILIIGYGTVGKACKKVLDQFELAYTICTSKNRVTRQMIMDHPILIHAIRLDETKETEPFLVTEDLKEPGRLSVICDISCDLGHPKNTLPIYDTFTTATDPVRSITSAVDLIAIPYLPSLEPVVSSEQFSSVLCGYLPHLLHFQETHFISEEAAALYRSYQKFIECK